MAEMTKSWPGYRRYHELGWKRGLSDEERAEYEQLRRELDTFRTTLGDLVAAKARR